MDNVTLPPVPATQNLVGTAAPKTQEQNAEVRAERVIATPESENNVNDRDQEQARFEAVRRAAQAVASNPFPVSDVRFTIYKEFNNNEIAFVTRFTSLESGEVTTIREPKLLAAASADIGTLLTASV